MYRFDYFILRNQTKTKKNFFSTFQPKPQKAKVKKKTVPKKSLAPTKKASTAGKDESSKVPHKKLKATPTKTKTKNVTEAKPNDDSDNSSNDSDSDRESHATDRKPALKKLKKSIARKPIIPKSNDVKEVVVRKRMASLNASAMMAATYEVERQLDKCKEKMYKVSADTEEHIAPPKKAKEIKNEVFEPKDVRIQNPLETF